MLKKGFTPLEKVLTGVERTVNGIRERYSLTGFTIVELLVVTVIIGILSALAIPQYQKMLERARVAEGVQILGALRKAQEVYYAQYARYEATIVWNDPTSLLIDIPSPKYFQWVLSSGTPVALAVRNGTDNAGYGTYTLGIFPNGNLVCRDGSVVGSCAKLGYPEF